MLRGLIKNCEVRGTILAQYFSGGLVGTNSWGSIIGCSFEEIVKTIDDTNNDNGEIGAGGIVPHSVFWQNEHYC